MVSVRLRFLLTESGKEVGSDFTLPSFFTESRKEEDKELGGVARSPGFSTSATKLRMEIRKNKQTKNPEQTSSFKAVDGCDDGEEIRRRVFSLVLLGEQCHPFLT